MLLSQRNEIVPFADFRLKTTKYRCGRFSNAFKYQRSLDPNFWRKKCAFFLFRNEKFLPCTFYQPCLIRGAFEMISEGLRLTCGKLKREFFYFVSTGNSHSPPPYSSPAWLWSSARSSSSPLSSTSRLQVRWTVRPSSLTHWWRWCLSWSLSWNMNKKVLIILTDIISIKR